MPDARGYDELDELIGVLSPEEAFAPVPGKPLRRVSFLRVGASDAIEERVVDGRLVLVTLPGVDVRHLVEVVYWDRWWELLYWGTDRGAAWALARRASAIYGVPVPRR